MTELETERLRLRRWRASDLNEFARMNADPEVMRFFPSVLERSESDATAQRIIDHFEQHGFGLWAVELKSGVPFIGFIGLAVSPFEADFTPCVEVGWRLAQEHWKNGYATEGALAAVQYGFQQLDLDEILSMTTVKNRPSRRVMEKLSMTHDPAEDFDHPLVDADSPICRHVLYRLKRNTTG